MTHYLVERTVRGWSRHDLETARLALQAGSRRSLVSASYLRTIFVPAQGRCLWFFRALSENDIRAVMAAAQLPGGHIDEVIELEGVPMS
jgi:hypothetical protein